ncbi:MAG: HIT family protein [Candidatus Aenigmarchaeota archaeon]|nr:HIT family protein [Candidatus Aenigmarchaeota archaeon]
MTEGEGGCLFCKIARGEIPSKKVYEDANVFAFLDINPRNPGHTLVIPKKHAATILEMGEKDVGALYERVRYVAAGVQAGTKADGLSIVQSNGKAAGQVVTHVHVHIIPRYLSEGPVSLEGVLGVKKMADETLDGIAASIKKSIGNGSEETGESDFDF